MPKLNRVPIEPTHDWNILQTRFTWPEQRIYEFIRPVVLFGQTPAARAQETGLPERTLYRKAERFDAHGLLGLLVSDQPDPDADRRNLPRDIRQAIVDLQVQYPALHAREIAVICQTRFDRRPSPHTIKRVLAEGDPAPSRRDRRYPPYHALADPHARRLAVVQLHSEGWSVKAIAGYLETTRATVYTILERWVTEKVLTEHSRAPKQLRAGDHLGRDAGRS